VTAAATEMAIGGERQVPSPDPIARDYLLLALRLDQRIPGLVDGYFGPAALKAQVDIEQLPSPARLVDAAVDLLDRLDREVADDARRDWLRVQLVALETHARSVAGQSLPYLEHVQRCFDALPVRHDDAEFERATQALDELLPGPGTLAERLAGWDARMSVPVDRLETVLDWLVGVVRAPSLAAFGSPGDDALRVSLVSGQPWAGYNWYDGGLRSRFDLNIDLPVRAPDLIGLVAHETYPGHHLEHAWHEALRVDERGELEASVLLINAPECFISEGLAEIGRRFAVPNELEPAVLTELFERSGLSGSLDPTAVTSLVERAIRIREARTALGAAATNAALMLHVDGVDRAAVMAWLEQVAAMSPERAAKRLEFIDHPLWRTYVFVYSEGAALLERWLAAAPPAEQASRFRRLFVEPATPSGIAREVSQRPQA
jgi:hypothetical protein